MVPTDRGDRVADGNPGSRVGLAASSAVLLASLSFGAGSIHVWAAEAHVAESVAEAAAFAPLADGRGWRDLVAILSAAAVACVTGTVTLGGHWPR